MALTKITGEGVGAVDNLTVDTNTLHVDAANNRVGVGTTSPASSVNVVDTSSTANVRLESGSGTPVILQTFASTSAGGAYVDVNSDHPLVFRTNATERARVTNNGLTFNGDTAAANALDDYEEGVHTATLTPSTSGSITLNSSFNTFQYVKIGNLVNVSGRVRVTSVSSPVGALRVSLPFTTADLDEDAGRVTGTGLIQGAVLNAGQYVIHPTADNNSYVEFYKGNGPNLGSATSNDFSGDELVSINITYRAA